MKRDDPIIFQERQKFTQKWVLLTVFLTAALFWYAFIQQIVLKNPCGNVPSSDFMVILTFMLFGLGLPYLFWTAELIIEVYQDGIFFRFKPFHRKFHKISVDEIRSFVARTYSPIKEFGGWGIRCGFKGKKAYNVRGNKGVQIELKNGKNVLFGSQRPDAFVQAIEKMVAG